jgi:hypothetical protein
VVGEAGEAEPDDVVGAAEVGERLRERPGHVGLRVAEGGQQQHPRIARRAGEMAQEQERRRVGPVPVLEHEQDRPAAEPHEQVGHRGVQPVALGVRIGVDRRRQMPDAGGEVRDQPRQLAARRAQRGAELVGIDDARRMVERLDERPVGRAHDGVARAVEHERAGAGRLGRELAQQAALARPGLAAEQHHAAALALGHGHERPQRLELRRAPDEREGRDEGERSG